MEKAAEIFIQNLEKIKMRKNLVQLEGLRGFAALYVFLHHANLFPSWKVDALFYFGQEAVILFFILSGFVIYFSTHVSPAQEISVKAYILHRFRRIYPIFLFSLLVAYIAACIHLHGVAPIKFKDLLFNIFMLQDVSSLKRGVFVDTYYGNSPLWSLSYEWWFYMLFIPLSLTGFLSTKTQRICTIAVSGVGFVTYQLMPNQFSLFAGYFILWWVGVELAREFLVRHTVTTHGQTFNLLSLLIFSILWAVPICIAMLNNKYDFRLGHDPVLQFRHFVAALCMLVIGLVWIKLNLVFIKKFFMIFAKLSKISYSLYLLHTPVLSIVGDFGINQYPVLRAVAALILLVPVCYLLEVRIQPVVNRLSDRGFSKYSNVSKKY